MKITINNEELNVLFTFKYQGKDYIVYEDKNGDYSASIYTYENNELKLFPILTDLEWDYVDQMIEEKINGKNNN